MDNSALDDSFVVFIRSDPSHGRGPEALEEPLATCSSYGEARRLQRAMQRPDHNCVIRFVGTSGGGD